MSSRQKTVKTAKSQRSATQTETTVPQTATFRGSFLCHDMPNYQVFVESLVLVAGTGIALAPSG